MPFLSLSLYNFRNLKNDNINLNFKEVFFVGENGQGKSNLLEALYYSAYGSSFRTHSDSQIIKNLQQNFSLISMYSNEQESLQRIKIIYDKKKSIEKNGKKIIVSAGLGEHTLPVRIHNPRELVMIELTIHGTEKNNGYSCKASGV